MDACLCCAMNIRPTEKKGCPLCGHSLIGQGWVGLDYHWKVRHEMTLPYGTFVEGLCEAHRGAQGVKANPSKPVASVQPVLPEPERTEDTVTRTPVKYMLRRGSGAGLVPAEANGF